VVVVSAAASHALWLPWFGRSLVRDDGPAKADIAVVLAGDRFGHRIEKAAQLVKGGYVPLVLVSGPPHYGVPECDLAIALMVKKGYPAEWFVPFPNNCLSTEDEARQIVPDLRRRGVRKLLLVTSSFHTARAARTFAEVVRSTGVPLEIRAVASGDEHFRADDWWRDREGQKAVFLEWSKFFARLFGF
jgi:uncharacterized SAM-binding protein YcdF (DUF218 family)